ncbi:MAG: hypothetical protein IPH07_32850 [Deltaproteobacteria bacterium]|nr:hypothetical protein [Deltaproteobacteria bacterium]MBP7285316.1 hypothetical protein [Nannocystaceae bacterium]
MRTYLAAAITCTWLTTACGTEPPQSSNTTNDTLTTDASASDSSTSDASSSSDGSSTTDGLHDGCWDHSFEGTELDEPVVPPWDAFSCGSLPTPCGDVELWVTTTTGELTIDETAMTPEATETADTNTRCILQGLRDATPGRYTVQWVIDTGIYGSITHYYVLDDGVVASSSANQDLDVSFFEAYRPLVAPSTFDPCIDEPDLIAAASCLSPPLAEGSIGFASAPALDADTCIDAVPTCPP